MENKYRRNYENIHFLFVHIALYPNTFVAADFSCFCFARQSLEKHDFTISEVNFEIPIVD
jgi:hypothetical protein